MKFVINSGCLFPISIKFIYTYNTYVSRRLDEAVCKVRKDIKDKPERFVGIYMAIVQVQLFMSAPTLSLKNVTFKMLNNNNHGF